MSLTLDCGVRQVLYSGSAERAVAIHRVLSRASARGRAVTIVTKIKQKYAPKLHQRG